MGEPRNNLALPYQQKDPEARTDNPLLQQDGIRHRPEAIERDLQGGPIAYVGHRPLHSTVVAVAHRARGLEDQREVECSGREVRSILWRLEPMFVGNADSGGAGLAEDESLVANPLK